MNTVLTWPDLEKQIRLLGEFERRALSQLLRGQPSTADPNERFDAHTDYEVNLRAEMEIMRLHAKLDAVREHEWEELLALQRDQIDALRRLEARLRQPHRDARTAGEIAGEGNT